MPIAARPFPHWPHSSEMTGSVVVRGAADAACAVGL